MSPPRVHDGPFGGALTPRSRSVIEILQLRHGDLAVEVARFHQFGMLPGADDGPVLENYYPVGVQDGADPLGHDDLGGPGGLLRQRGAQVAVRLRIQGGEGVVEQVDRRVLAYRAGYGQPLLLPSGEVPPVLRHIGIQTFRHPVDQIVQLGYAQGAHRLLIRPLGAAVADVVLHGAGEHHGGLRDVSYHRAELVLGVLPHIGAPDGNRPG